MGQVDIDHCRINVKGHGQMGHIDIRHCRINVKVMVRWGT